MIYIEYMWAVAEDEYKKKNARISHIGHSFNTMHTLF